MCTYLVECRVFGPWFFSKLVSCVKLIQILRILHFKLLLNAFGDEVINSCLTRPRHTRDYF